MRVVHLFTWNKDKDKDVSNAGDQVSERARFAAREFVARLARETGETLSQAMTDRILLAFEIGYLRGRTDGARDTLQMMTEAERKEK